MDTAIFSVHHDLEERHWWFRARRHVIREIGMRLLPEGGRIVDVGCGTGADLASFPPSFERYGIDVSPEAIAFARSRYPEVGFELGNVPDDGVDAVAAADLLLLCDVLEHIEDDAAFLSALIGTMKPGAHLLVTVPADPRLWSPHDEAYGHWRRYTRTTFSGLLSGLPVEVRLLAPFNRRLYPLARVVRSLSASRGESWGTAATDLSMPNPLANRLLERIFAGEASRLVGALNGQSPPTGNGVSLIAVLRRQAAAERVSTKTFEG